jgi:hypothetical protein
MPPSRGTYFATVDIGDNIFGAVDGRAIEVEIAHSGFAVVKPRAPDRWQCNTGRTSCR